MVMVVAQHRQVWVSLAGSVCGQRQVTGSWTGRAIVIAAVASIAAARVRHVVVQRRELVVMQVAVAVRLDSPAAAQNVVDHEAGARRLQDGHGAALHWHRHLGGGAVGAELGQSANLCGEWASARR